jgi:glycyl-tRNA synthetase
MATPDMMEKIVSLCKRRGFVFPGSEIYGGLANSWDYGPLGVELKNNIRDWWWQRFVQSRDDMVGIDAAIIMNPKVWEASGHLKEFSDPLVECKKCNTRYRADQLETGSEKSGSSWTCENCGEKNGEIKPRQFNMMFKTFVGTTDESASTAYLRPEIAQAMFVNFKNVLDTTRKHVPFGIASVGKAFRNEITPGNFIFRTLEFDLMEFEYFCREEEWEKHFEYWLGEQQRWLSDMGFGQENLRLREHEAHERAHYSKRTVDVEYNTPFGWKEMFGLAYRTDFDLKNHSKNSGQELLYTDPETGEKLTPHVIEPTFGLTRLLLMMLLDSYREDGEGDKKRVYLKLHPRVAPYKAAVFPLLANKPELVEKAREIYSKLKAQSSKLCNGPIAWDARGNIGKRYYAQDEIGTPYCITVDFDTLEKGDVTVRDRDTATQERVKVEELMTYLQTKIG